MKILKKAKLVVLISLITLAFGCESKVTDPIPDEKSEVEQKVKQPSLLRQQIQLMLAGKEHSEAILQSEVGKQEWKATFAILKEELVEYTSQYGSRPKKKYITRTHALLSKLRAELNLEDAQRRNKESLDDFEKTIQRAIRKEKNEKSSH